MEIYDKISPVVSRQLAKLMSKIELATLLKIVLIGISIIYVLICFFIMFERLNYPHELEWLEGQTMAMSMRIMNGEQYYCQPSIDFIPAIYTPFYYFFISILYKLFGVSLFTPRLVSILSTFIILLVIYLVVFRETKKHFYSIIAIGLMCTAYNPDISDFWFDIAKQDMFYLMILFIGFYCLYYIKNNAISIILGSIFFSLAILTKQPAGLIAGFVGLHLLITKWRKGLIFGLLVSLFTGISFLLMQIRSSGWFYTYCFKIPSMHRIEPIKLLGFTSYSCFFYMGIVLSIIFLFFVLSKKYKYLLHHYFFSFGIIITSTMGYVKVSGYKSNYIPIILVFSLLFAISLRGLIEIIKNKEEGNNYQSFLLFIVLMQFSFMLYSPKTPIPSTKDISAGNRVVNSIQNLDGNVFTPDFTSFNLYAGKKLFFHKMGFEDIINSGDNELLEIVKKSSIDAFKAKEIDYIVLLENAENRILFKFLEIDRYFDFYDRIEYQDLELMCKSGIPVRPAVIYRNKKLSSN